VGLRELGRELEAKGYPGPTGDGWNHHSVYDLLTTVEFVGTARWGQTGRGKYHQAIGSDITPVRNGTPGRHEYRKTQADVIHAEGAIKGLLPADLFARVQRKLQRAERRRPTAKATYPLGGLIVCEHCGQPMEGSTRRYAAKGNQDAYVCHEYICRTYSRFGRDGTHNTTCGRHTIDARRILAWLVFKLQEVYLGPGRDILVSEIKKGLQREKKAPSVDTGRLEKRAADLEREIGRLVKAIRTIDAAELVEELALVQAERERVKAEITQASRLTTVSDIDAEAEAIADSLVGLGERLTATDPAVLRETLHQFVDRIDCRWKATPGRKRSAYKLIRGDVVLRDVGVLLVGVMGLSP
jgi:hypothetical protein